MFKILTRLHTILRIILALDYIEQNNLYIYGILHIRGNYQ